jgi:hypothetical protein
MATCDAHSWLTRTRHRTSEGVVSYQRCSGCGQWRLLVGRRRVVADGVGAARSPAAGS